MILNDFLPHPALREYVRCYRLAHFVFDEQDQTVCKLYPPRPEHCLHFIMRGNETVHFANGAIHAGIPVAIFGQQTSTVKRILSKEFLILQIAFQPGALYMLTGMPVYLFTNQYVDAKDIFSDIGFVHEQLQAANSYNEMIAVVDNFLINLIEHPRIADHPLDLAARQILYHPQQLPVEMLAKQSFLCSKQFTRRFNDRVGISPKTFSKLTRFIRVYNYRNKFPKHDWSRIAIKLGYCDYQHLVKDYKTFSGLKPNELHIAEKSSPENILGLARSVYNIRS